MAMDTNYILQNETADELFSQFMDPDHLTDKWILTGTPGPIVSIIATYLFVVLKVGPTVMSERDAYNLQFVMRLYNIAQVLLNGYIVIISFITTNENTPFVFVFKTSCTLPDEFEGLNNLKNMYLLIGWSFIVLKIIDLLDTVFMVLRKKSSQVTFLHVYHHAATVFFSWYSFRYTKAPQGGVMLWVNAFVHMVMYIYYFLATFDSLKKYLWWKQALTKLQLAQFVVLLTFMFCLYYNNCLVSRSFTIIWMFNVALVMCLFINFYVKSYLTKSPSTDSDKNKLKVS